MKSYVVLSPYSTTNPSARYRVVDFAPWRKFTDGEAVSYPVESDHGTRKEAEDAAAVLNDGAGVQV